MSENKDYAGDISPKQAWEMLSADDSAVLLDVRTQAEWAYVGIPDPSGLGKQTVFVQWLFFPDKRINPQFAPQVAAGGIGEDDTVIIICRSGIRSKDAAIALTSLGYKTCYNVATGFEGDRDTANHRGSTGGWKVDGLPWVQE